MLKVIILSLVIGSLMGFIFELVYRSFNARKIVIPRFINYQMYGTTGIFLAILFYLNLPEFIKLILMFVIPTVIEFITGYLYLKIKGEYLWDYKNEWLNFMGLICPLYSAVWFIIATSGYYIILPLLVR